MTKGKWIQTHTLCGAVKFFRIPDDAPFPERWNIPLIRPLPAFAGELSTQVKDLKITKEDKVPTFNTRVFDFFSKHETDIGYVGWYVERS